jgi:PAS domain S-box-containing protein
MAAQRSINEQRVLILAPTVRDGEATAQILRAAGTPCVRCDSLDRLSTELRQQCAAVILPEEVLLEDDFECVAQTVRSQPVWSDLPIIVLSRTESDLSAIENTVLSLGNVSVIERPMRISTFLSVVRVGLRARERQYQVRDHLEERAMAEQALARDAALLTNVRDSVIVTDLAGIVTYWNDGAAALFGWTAKEMLGRHISTRVPEEVRAEVYRRIERIIAGEKEFSGEWLDYRKDGSRVWIESTIRLARSWGGDPMGIIGVSRDITQRKEAELELKKSKEIAEAANAAKDEFLAVLSHELRTPLTPVLLSASMLETSPMLPESLQSEVATIRENVELESRLIGDLLDVTRIARGKLKLDMQEWDVHLLLRGAIAICQRSSSARIVTEFEATRHIVRGDSTRLQQVFWNLINNAAKFTGPDGLITVASRDLGDDRVQIRVTDTGEGIDPAILPRLFNAFEQGEVRTNRQRAGLGLGLSISRRLTELHGGTISAFSEGHGRGATFTVELPATAQVTAANYPALPPGAPAGEAKLRILLVEDHEPTLAVMSKLLRTRGHHVTGVNSVATATAAAELNGFDLVISDLGLPDGSGLDVMRALQNKYSGRAIALTGYGMEADVAACRQAGFATHLTKPVNVPDLESAIREVVGNSKKLGRGIVLGVDGVNGAVVGEQQQ